MTTDYHPLIARAVQGLVKNTGEARRALYERARTALVAQLRGVDPALPESEITKERLALEEAIRKVESEAARKVLGEPRPRRPEPRIEPRKPASLPRALPAEPEALRLSAAPMALRRERRRSADDDHPPADEADAQGAEPESSEHDDPPAQADERRLSGKLTARNRILQARTTPVAREARTTPVVREARTTPVVREARKGFRSLLGEADGLGAATAKAAHTARETRDSYAPASRTRRAKTEDFITPPEQDQFEARFDRDDTEYDDTEHADSGMPQLQSLEPPFHHDQPAPLPRPARPPPPAAAEAEEEYEQPRPPRSYRGLAKVAALLIVLVGAGATTVWQWPHIVGFYQSIVHKSQPPTQAAATPPQVKFPGRVPQEQVPGQAPSANAAPGAAPSTEPSAQVAQRAVLYEADPNDPQGKQSPGSVVWRTETVSPGPGLAPELAIRADIAIPERHMTVTWSLRRNTDKALPASHTIELMFSLPPDFPGGSIANVPGILMKDKEEVRGVPLAGLAVKVTNGFFLIGLNAADEEMQRNLQLLKEKAWFDILLVYSNGGRAILTMEKGPPGDRAFAEAFSAWKQ